MKKELVIEGMTCGHCKMRVEKALLAVNGVESVEVILSEKKAIVVSNQEIDDSVYIEAVDDAGYDVISVS